MFKTYLFVWGNWHSSNHAQSNLLEDQYELETFHF
jgi:hypothetical protein